MTSSPATPTGEIGAYWQSHGGELILGRPIGRDEYPYHVTALLNDGRKVHVRVEHAIGSLDRPMTDRNLEDKFHSLADGVIGADKAGALIAACWKLGEARDVTQIIERAIP